MKKLITTLFTLIVILLLTGTSVKAATTHPITTAEEFSCSNTNIAASTWVTYTYASYTSRSNTCDNGSFPNLSASARAVVFYVSGCSSFTINADGNSSTRYLTYQINTGTAVQTAAWPAGCSAQTFNTGNTGAITITIAGVSGSVYLGTVKFFPPAVPTMTAFSAAGVSATINESSTPKTVTAVLPYGTNLTNITPTVTIGGSATSYSPTGAQDFSGGAVNYILTDGASTPTTTTYAVTLTALMVANSDATLSDLKVDGTSVTGFSAATLTYNVTLPYVYSGLPVISSTVNAVTSGQVVTQVSAIPGSATVLVTAQDGSQKTYTVNFTRTPISTACDITSFSINGKVGVIDPVANTILVQMHLTTVVTGLTPTVVVSNLATYTPSGAQNFTNPVPYIVTAQDGTQKTYTVAVQLLDLSYTGTYPYITNFPSGYVIPAWMSSPTGGIIFTDPYTGTDKASWYDNSTETTNATASVIRFNTNTSMELLVSQCGTVTAKVSATGTRTYNLYINGTLANTANGTTNAMSTLTANPNLFTPTTIRIENPSTSGGITLGYLEIDAPVTTNISQNRISGVTFDGQTIHNNSNLDLKVFDATGRLMVISNKNIDMNSYSKGMYLVKSNSATLKITK